MLDYEVAQHLEKDKADTLFLLSIRKVLDEDLDEDILEEAKGNVTLLASAVAGGISSKKVQKFAVEKLSRLVFFKDKHSNAETRTGPGCCSIWPVRVFRSEAATKPPSIFFFFNTPLSGLLDVAIGKKKIYIVAKVFDRPGYLAYLCKMPNEVRCPQETLAALRMGARTLFWILRKSIRSTLPTPILRI